MQGKGIEMSESVGSSDMPEDKVNADSNPNEGHPSGGKRPGLLVILCGLVTTMVTLVIIYLCHRNGFQPMSLYIFLIVPVGAILVGILAGSGYALASWWTGAKIGGGLLALVLLLQVAAYFGVEYFEYSEASASFSEFQETTIQQIEAEQGALNDQEKQQVKDVLQAESGMSSFGTYFDVMTRSFAFDTDNGPAQPLDTWGYGIRLLEILGFGIGGLIGPLMLRSKPYCTKCQVYQKTRQLGLLPAGIKPRKVKKKDAEGQAALQQDADEALQGGLQLMEESAEMATDGQTNDFRGLLNEFKSDQKEIGKHISRINVSLQFCPDCQTGLLVYSLVSGQGEDTATELLAAYDVGHAFVSSVKAGT